MKITLAEALRNDRLPDFAAQAEDDGVGPIDRAQFDGLLRRVTAPLPEGQTSRLRERGASRGK